VESLAASLPVITNDTGDIGRFLSDGCEGILLADCSVQAVVDGIERLLAVGRPSWREMRLRARARAAYSFDYQAHSERIREFTDELRVHNTGCEGQCKRNDTRRHSSELYRRSL
jgi:glycosyltransferase involved in cell wall biosynthesis